MTAVLNGKQVLAPPKDIAEVKNAFEIYERLDELDPYSVDDLLTAHGIMTLGLVEESGMFRSRPVGVVDSEGYGLHLGTLPQYVPDLVMELLDWTKTSEVHMLIRSCVFHYELELIHPFADGNGRVGRLWHTLLLSKWNPAFVWLPVESIIHDRQQDYYAAINASNDAGESTVFIEFMLSAIKASLMDQLEKITLADPNLSEKMNCIPVGYEDYDVTNTQYVEEIDGNTTGTLGVNCSKGKMYLSKSLTSTQFRTWSTRRINDIIRYFQNSTDVTFETVTGFNMFTSSMWDGLKQSSIPILVILTKH